MLHRYAWLLTLTLSGVASAQADAPESDNEGLGLNLDLGVESAYIFRGYHVFQTDSQMDQTLFAAPSLTWAIGDTGLSLGYWGAYQLTGGQISEKVDAALGAEQNLLVNYEIEVAKDVIATGGLVLYFYPFADEEVAGVSTPSILEPSAGIAWATAVDLGFKVAYFRALQEEISSLRYVYLNPSVGKVLDLSDSIVLEGSLAFGYKIYEDSEIEDNKYDVMLLAGLPIATGGGLYLRPVVGGAWTNFEARDLGDEVAIWGGLHVGADL